MEIVAICPCDERVKQAEALASNAVWEKVMEQLNDNPSAMAALLPVAPYFIMQRILDQASSSGSQPPIDPRLNEAATDNDSVVAQVDFPLASNDLEKAIQDGTSIQPLVTSQGRTPPRAPESHSQPAVLILRVERVVNLPYWLLIW